MEPVAASLKLETINDSPYLIAFSKWIFPILTKLENAYTEETILFIDMDWLILIVCKSVTLKKMMCISYYTRASG